MGRFAWELRQCIVSFLYREHRCPFPCVHCTHYVLHYILFFLLFRSSFLVWSITSEERERNDTKTAEKYSERDGERKKCVWSIDVSVWLGDDDFFSTQKLIHRKL